MAEKGFGIDLKNALQGAAETVKSSVKDVKLPQIRKSERKNLREESERTCLSARNAIKIFYYLMAADGQIFQGEEEKFDAIGKEFDAEFLQHKEQIIAECQVQMDKVIDSEDYYDVLQEGVEEALNSSIQKNEESIGIKLLLWDLLTIAYSDNNYDSNERKLLKYIVRKADVEKTVFLEMESMFLTLIDLENEIMWIKKTDRPYLTIEAMVNELENRKNVILNNVKDIVSL